MLGALVLAAVTALVYLIDFMKKPEKNKKAKWITASALAVLLVIGICGGAYLGSVAIDPNVLIGPLQKSFAPSILMSLRAQAKARSLRTLTAK